MALTCGCAVSFTESAFLPDYAHLEKDTSLKHFWWNPPPQTPISQYDVLYIQKPLFDPLSSYPDLPELADLLHDRLYWRALTAFRNRLIIITGNETTQYEKTGRGVYTLRTYISDVRRGNGLIRYLIGLGQGAVRCQIEGRGVSYQDETENCEFITVSVCAGKPYGFFNPRVISSKYCLRIAVDQAAQRITTHLVHLLFPDNPT